MKRMIRLIGVILSLVLVFASPVYADNSIGYSSYFFASYDSSIRNPSGSTLEIWFDVVSNGAMDEIGVSSIELEYSSDEINWFHAKTFLPEDYPQMIRDNSGINYNCVTYTGMYDFCYRAYVTFYAKNSRGTGYTTQYSETYYIPMP